jgi:plasmid stabilization system protein ParE
VPHFTIRPLAWREINKQLDYLEEKAGLETAERFLEQLISSLDTLTRIAKNGRSLRFPKADTATPPPLAGERLRELEEV